MDRVTVQSSNVRSIGYDAANRLLEVEFRSGDVYRYEDVLLSEHEELMAAKHKGKFVAWKIRPNRTFYKVRPEFDVGGPPNVK